MWRVLGNASLDQSAAVPRQPQRKPVASAALDADSSRTTLGASGNNTRKPIAATAAVISKAVPDGAAAICGKYRITGTMRKGATGYLYSAVAAVPDGEKKEEGWEGVGGGGEVVLKVEECAAPKRQMQNEWAVRLHPALDPRVFDTRATSVPGTWFVIWSSHTAVAGVLCLVLLLLLHTTPAAAMIYVSVALRARRHRRGTVGSTCAHGVTFVRLDRHASGEDVLRITPHEFEGITDLAALGGSGPRV